MLMISVNGQDNQTLLYGQVTDTVGNPVILATLTFVEAGKGVSTDSSGAYSILLPHNTSLTVKINHVQFEPHRLNVRIQTEDSMQYDMVIRENIRILQQVEITSGEDINLRRKVSSLKLDAQHIEVMPAPFSDVGHILATLPGVSSNNELSNTYSVRGGSYEENLVYVNDIPVYRPFLVRAGQQEGMSFVNPDLVRQVEFSSGGWEPAYGDKLSSSLNVTYKNPEKFRGSFQGGLLGGSLHLEGTSGNKKISYLTGIRHKRTRYLLNTLDVDGEYLPRFTDMQAYLSYDLDKPENLNGNRSEIGLLLAYSDNQYHIIPANRVTSFGTFNRPLNLFVAFDGQEILTYNTYQAAARFSHTFNPAFRTVIILSDYYTRERERFDVEAGYRLCDVDRRPESPTFDQCLSLRGIGTNYESARNKLDGNIVHAEIRNELVLANNHILKFGMGNSYRSFDDYLHEYSFVDSADYVSIENLIKTENQIRGNELAAYLQHETNIKGRHFFIYGLRVNYLDINKQWLFSPRLQYTCQPEWSEDILFRSAAGVYQQPPFYREYRRPDGSLNYHVKAQSSIHLIGGVDYNFLFWNRTFKLTTEIYYKYLHDVNPYDIENVRVRYFADNLAWAYAMGMDLRISGEFIPGNESWFSLGILKTEENLQGDSRGYYSRPTDQLVNFNIFFQDHIPGFPSYRVNLNYNLATGLPFGPPGNRDLRNRFRGDYYHRIDLGFSKVFEFNKAGFPETLWTGIEVLNLTGRENVITYYWVKDFNNYYYGVPNSLTTRFFNIKIMAEF